MRPCLRRQTKAVASLQPLGANEMAQAWKGACHLSLVTWVQSPSWFPHLTNMPSSTYRWRDVHKGKTSVPRTPKPTRWQSCASLGGGQEGGVLAALVHPECKYSYNCCQVLVQVPMGAPGRRHVFCDIYCEHQLSRVPCFSAGSQQWATISPHCDLSLFWRALVFPSC